MFALTIMQPYAELIVAGEKRVENRIWATAHRGLLLIHAGRSRAWFDSWPLGHVGGVPLENLTLGAIVGVCDLVDCVQFDAAAYRAGRGRHSLPAKYSWLLSDEHASGRFCFILENPLRFQQPVECAGQQQMWRPDAVIMRGVEQQIALARGSVR
jgi:hypothetical protein